MAILPVLVLVVFTLFGSFPHWWHEDGTGGFCSICQAGQLRAVEDSVGVTVSPPVSAGFGRPPHDVAKAIDGEPIAAIGRSPPA